MPKKDLERSTIVDTTIAELNKKYGSGSIMRLGDMGGAEVVPKFTSGIASLDLALGGGWPYGRIIEVYGPESSGKCLTEDTRILTKNGYKTIKEIFNENGLETYCVSKAVEVVYPLVNKDGNLEDTTHFVFNNRRPVNKIVMKSGSVIKSTDMHPMCIIDENGFMVWKYSKDIVPGDYLVGRKGDKYSSKSSLVSTEEAILLGVMVADAYFGEAKISLTNNSPEIISLFSRSTEIIEEFSGLELKQYLAKNHENNGSLDFQINSKEQIPKFYDRVGIKSGLAKDKNVPASILRSNIDIQAAFLKGYFDCESELSSGVGEIVVTSASFDLLSSIQLMLRNMGILSYISKKVVKKYEDNDYWRLGIYSHYVEKFYNEIGFLSQERIEKIEEILKERNSTRSDRIPNIEGLVVSYYSSVDKRHKNSETSDWIYSIKSQKSGVSVDKLKMLLETPSQNVHLRQLLMTYLDEHLYFDEVCAVEKMDSVPTFDFSMKDTHTFIAEGIINHNTSLCLFAMAEVQKLGKKVAFIDLENALDPMLAEMYGVDTNNMYLGYPDTGEAAFAIIEGLAQTGEFGCIVLDSVSAILPNAEREEDVGKSLPAIQARLMSQALRRLVGVLGKSQTTVFFVNQIREKVGVMYGCLHAETLVNFVDGRSLPIREVVENKINGEVWSFNEETGEYEPKRIVGWHYNGEVETPEDFIHIQTESIDGGGRFGFTVTPNHLVLTDNGWIEAKDITMSTRIASKYRSTINGTLGDFMWGSFVGDSTILIRSQNTGSYKIQDTKNKEYMLWKLSKISNHIKMRRNADRFESDFSYEFAKIKREIGNRNPLSFLKDHFSPMGLAIWYMDDGSLNESEGRRRVTLSIKRFKDSEVLNEIVEEFRKKGFDVSAHSSSGSIIFNRDASNYLFESISQFVPDCMQYKLPEEFQGRYQDFELTSEPKIVQDFVKVKEIRYASKRQMRQKGRYDISVEDNHNYVVGGKNNGIVVHNSPEITSGGRALSFYASQRINVRIDTFLDEKGKEQKSRDGAFGHKTNIQVSKNKVAPPFKRAGFILEYGKGFDKYYDVLLVAEELGIIGKGGAWYNYVPEDKSLIAEGEENLRWQGRNNLLNDLKSNHKLFAEIQQKTFKEVGALYSKPKSLEEVMEEPDES